MESLREKGIVFVLSSPSGGGKSSLSKALLEMDGNLELSISVTTREKKKGERDGIDYFFKNREEFDSLKDSGFLLESASIYGEEYGTPKEFVINRLNLGKDLIFDIDYQGMESLKKGLEGYSVVSIFLLPPSYEILKERLEKRNRDGKENLEFRLKEAKKEIFYAEKYDYALINQDFDSTLNFLYSIISAQRHKTPVLNKLGGFLYGFGEGKK